jgi:hypothetical protein
MTNITDDLELDGLVHIWGRGGSGKTHLAIAIASEVAIHSHVLWINTDGKYSFIPRLRLNITSQGGKRENVSIVLGHRDAAKAVGRVRESMRENTGIIVVDTISRVLDLGRKDPTMWGRELIEHSLPTLAGITHVKDCPVLILSEGRQLEDGASPVHHELIRKFSDYEIQVQRDLPRPISTILRTEGDTVFVLAEMVIDDEGLVDVTAVQKETRRDLEFSERLSV